MFRGMVPHNRPLTLSGIITDKDVVEGEPRLECDVFLQNEEGTRLVIGMRLLCCRCGVTRARVDWI